MYFEIEVERDEFAQDPTRDMDMASINVFDDQASFCTFMSGKGWDEAQPLYSDDGAVKAALGGEVLKDYDGNLYMGLEQYSHSGDVLALCRSGNFPDRRWDVSPIVGFISPHLDADSDVIKQYHDLAAEGKVDEARISIGSTLPTPGRFTPAEELLKGNKPSIELAQAAADACSAYMIQVAGRRWSAEYKEPVVRNLARRGILKVFGLEQAPEESLEQHPEAQHGA